jgi:hypothetical protein
MWANKLTASPNTQGGTLREYQKTTVLLEMSTSSNLVILLYDKYSVKSLIDFTGGASL